MVILVERMRQILKSKRQIYIKGFVYPSSFYFLYFAALSVYSPFLVLYYQQLGLSGSQTGILLGAVPLIGLIAAPYWTGLADSSHRHRNILLLTMVLASLAMAILPIVRGFPFVLLVISIFTFFVAPIVALVDSATLTMLGDQRDRYGRIRIWGTIGWGLAAPLAGLLLQTFGLKWMFWFYAALMLLNIIPAINLKFTSSTNEASLQLLKGLRSVIMNRRWIGFLALIFIAGIGLSAHSNYLAILVEDKGGDRSLLGIALFITTLSELPMMFFSQYVLKKLKSRGLLILAVTFAGLRCLLYSVVGSPQTILILQLMHGLTFPSLWVAGVTYVAENAPASLGATVQAVFGGVLTGFGFSAGGVLSGVLIDLIGLQGMFAVFGLIVFCGLGMFLVFDRTPGH